MTDMGDMVPHCYACRRRHYGDDCPKVRGGARTVYSVGEAISLQRETLRFCREMLWRGWPILAADRASMIAEIDRAIAAGTQSAETSETSAPSEGCQSGPKGIAPMTAPPNHPRST